MKKDPLKMTGRQALKELNIPLSMLKSKSSIRRVLDQIRANTHIRRVETAAAVKKHMDSYTSYVSVCAQATRALRRKISQ